MIKFPGKIEYSYAEGNHIWAYDELSMGLYDINLDTANVKMVLDSTQIHKSKNVKIIGIVKRNKDIILIPQLTSDEWIVYGTENRQIKYFCPIQSGYQIKEVQQNGNLVYLLPSLTKEPIFLISLENMKCFKFISNWHIENKKKEKVYSCWGSSLDGKDVIFPIVKTNYICRVNENGVTLINVNIRTSILAVSMHLNNMWILPTEGKHLYIADKKGKINNQIELPKNFGLSANKLVRIIALEQCVLLFPREGNDIYIFIYAKKQFIKISAELELGIGKLWKCIGGCPFWNYHVNNEKLYVLPIKHCFLEVDLSTFKPIENKLMFDNAFDENNYWKGILWLKRENGDVIFKDYGEGALNNFAQLMQKIEIREDTHLSKFGELIWKYCKIL